MKIATSEIMGNIDRFCIDTLKIPSIILMENAALKVIKNIDMGRFNSFIVVCGNGNNGGDGLAVARHLISIGKMVQVFLLGKDDEMSLDCKTNYHILKNIGVKINRINNVEDIDNLRDAILRSEATIDAIFGTGLSRDVQGSYDAVISIINVNSSYILSIDVPSGFNCNSGKVMGNCVSANKTVSFQLYKRGFLSYCTDKLTGEIVIENIGIPQFVVEKFHNNEFMLDKNMIKEKLILRDKYDHKGDFGRVLIVAGSRGFTGAAYISTEAAVRTGSGNVTLCCPEDITDIMASKIIEAMIVSISEDERLNKIIGNSHAIAIGPGMGDNEKTLELVSKIVREAKCPVVIDADGLNSIKNNLDILKESKNKIILTPHLGEMAKLTGRSIEYIKDNRIEVAQSFAKEYGVILLLKGFNTVITDGKCTMINPTGNSSMASGGMGDCLTGMVVAFLGQGYSPFVATYIAAFVHGLCGEKLSENSFCVNARDILKEIPKTIFDCMKSPRIDTLIQP